MSLFENLENVPDAVIVDDGVYEVRAEKAELKVSAKNVKYVNIMFVLTEEEMAEPVYYSLFLPGTDADERQNLRRLRDAKHFADCFGLSHDFELQDIMGVTGHVNITSEDYNGQKQNKIKSLVGGVNE